MFRFTLLLLTIMPVAAFAQDEEPDLEFGPDRMYECHDRFADNPEPYVFVETFAVPLEEIADEIPEDARDDVSDEDIAQALEALEALAMLRFATVMISEAEFSGMAYQAGLDYRIDFGHDFDGEIGESESATPHSLIIQAGGDTAYYDFSNSESGERKGADRLMTCKRTQ